MAAPCKLRSSILRWGLQVSLRLINYGDGAEFIGKMTPLTREAKP